MNDDLQVPLTNCEKRRKPAKNIFWCWGCDQQIIVAGKKCPVCGHIDRTKQARKRDIKVYDTNAR